MTCQHRAPRNAAALRRPSIRRSCAKAARSDGLSAGEFGPGTTSYQYVEDSIPSRLTARSRGRHRPPIRLCRAPHPPSVTGPRGRQDVIEMGEAEADKPMPFDAERSEFCWFGKADDTGPGGATAGRPVPPLLSRDGRDLDDAPPGRPSPSRVPHASAGVPLPVPARRSACHADPELAGWAPRFFTAPANSPQSRSARQVARWDECRPSAARDIHHGCAPGVRPPCCSRSSSISSSENLFRAMIRACAR